jgi:hypothetical protein
MDAGRGPPCPRLVAVGLTSTRTRVVYSPQRDAEFSRGTGVPIEMRSLRVDGVTAFALDPSSGPVAVTVQDADLTHLPGPVTQHFGIAPPVQRIFMTRCHDQGARILTDRAITLRLEENFS